MRTFLSKSLALMLVLVFAAAACAQREEGQRGQRGQRGERGGRGGFGQFGGGGGFGGRGGGFQISRMMLVSLDPVQKELGLVEEQVTKIGDARRQARGDRGGRGERGGDRPDFRNMTDEERQEFMAERQKEADERTQKENEQLAEILMEHQGKRLQEIFIQVRGVSALQDPAVAKELGLTEDDLEEIRETTQEAGQKLREEMGEDLRAAFESRDQEQIREKMAEMQKKIEEEVMAVLSSEQKEKFASMKGEKFDMPADALRGAFGGPGGGGRGGRGGEGRPNRPQRPTGDSV